MSSGHGLSECRFNGGTALESSSYKSRTLSISLSNFRRLTLLAVSIFTFQSLNTQLDDKAVY